MTITVCIDCVQHDDPDCSDALSALLYVGFREYRYRHILHLDLLFHYNVYFPNSLLQVQHVAVTRVSVLQLTQLKRKNI